MKRLKKILIFFICLSSSFITRAQQWIVYRDTNSALPSNWVSKIAIDKFDNKWLLGAPSNLIKYDGISWTIYNHTNSGLPNAALNALAIDKNNNIWIGTDSGLVKFDSTSWTTYNTINSCLPINKIRDCDLDTFNNVWAATDSGIVKFDTSLNCSVFNTSNGSLQGIDNVSEIKVDSRNWVWSINPSGMGWVYINVFNGSTWQNLTNYGQNVFPNHIFCDTSGNVWFSAGNGILKFDGTAFSVPYDTSTSFYFHGIVPVYANSNFIAAFSNTTVSLDYYDGIGWSHYSSGNSPLHGVIFKFACDQFGNLWMVGDYGVYEFNPNGIVTGSSNLIRSDLTIEAYPIPTNSLFHIDIISDKVSSIDLILYDSFGQRINCPYEMQFKGNNEKIITINLDGLSDGIYLYKMINNNVIKTGKIILTRQ